MRVWMKGLISFVLVTCSGYLLDRFLRYEGMPRRDLLFLSDVLVGAVAAILVYIAYHSSFKEDKESIAVIDDAVKRIAWALREVLPQLPAEY